jgi:hypothetical protein
MAAGFGLGKGDGYLAALSAELGQKPPAGKATPAMVLDALDQVIASRLGKPFTKAIETEEEEPEEDETEEAEEDDEAEDEDEASKKSAPSKPKSAAKSKAKPKPKKR